MEQMEHSGTNEMFQADAMYTNGLRAVLSTGTLFYSFYKK
tara:strand:- start:143 stop:262 length:120 start_codon:yes stop_codon:yes gene_type:complete